MDENKDFFERFSNISKETPEVERPLRKGSRLCDLGDRQNLEELRQAEELQDAYDALAVMQPTGKFH